jgi:hypothetical protein
MKALLICTFLMLTSACSDRWRTSDPQISGTDVLSYLQAAQGTNATNVGGTGSEISTTDANTQIFFADAPGPMGTVASVLAFDDLSWIGANAPDLSTVTQARVFFLDNTSSGQHQDELIIGVGTTTGSDFQYFKFYGNGSVDSGQFQMSFTDGNGNTLALLSNDVDGDRLSGTIQLRAYTADSDGNLQFFGQFSVLAGFQ